MAIFPLFTICKQYSNHTGLILVPKSTLSRVCFRAHISFPLSGILLSSLPLFPPEPKSGVLREIFSAILFYDPLISSFPENTTVLSYFICFLSSPLDPQISPCPSIHHWKPVTSRAPDTWLMLSKFIKWLNERTRIFQFNRNHKPSDTGIISEMRKLRRREVTVGPRSHSH